MKNWTKFVYAAAILLAVGVSGAMAQATLQQMATAVQNEVVSTAEIILAGLVAIIGAIVGIRLVPWVYHRLTGVK